MSDHISVRISRAALLYGVFISVAFAAIFWATRAWPDTPDGLFHLHRVRALGEALRAGVLYPRWFPDFAFGHGYPVFHYYAPAFYYAPALLNLLGLDLMLATRAALAVVFALSGGAMILLLRRWTGWGAAIFGAVVYLAYPYRLYDFFVRGALPEFAAFVWLPLLVYGGGAVASSGLGARSIAPWRTPHQAASFVLLALAAAGLIVTHNLTALMAGIAGGIAWLAATGILLVTSRKGESDHWRMGWYAGAGIGAALLMGLLLSAPYAVPALLDARWVEIGAGASGAGYANHFATWQSLWSWDAVYPYPAASEPTVPAPAYALVIMCLSVAVLPWSGRLRTHIIVACVSSLAALWLMTAGSDPVWRAGLLVMSKIQFPWRWHTMTALSLAVQAALLAEVLALRLGGRPVAQAWYWAGVGLVGLYLAVYSTVDLPNGRMPIAADELTAEQMWAFDAQHGQVGATWTSEFLPKWVTAPSWAIGREADVQEPIGSQDPVTMQVQVGPQGYLKSSYRIAAPSPVTVTLPSFYFPAWRARIDGEVAATSPNTSLALLAVAMPAGEHELLVTWGPTLLIWIGRVAWALGWLGVLGVLWVRRRSCWRFALPVWIGVGCLFVLVAGGWTEQAARPAALSADFGAVQLVGASATAVRPGETAAVRLIWTVSGPVEPLTAFVHVVDESGKVVAQNDAPLGGVYMPASRWASGMVLHVDHLIAVPADLAAGTYRLFAGVYRPGRADAPLMAAGQSGSRVEIGTLEIVR